MEKRCEEILSSLYKKPYLAPSLKRMNDLDASLGFPSKAFPTVHVAGTNGKGSVSIKMASGLSQLGYKTGLFTSPHISSFRERIQIDGEKIPIEEAYALLQEVVALAKELPFFEVLTLMAFLYFSRKGVDYAVIETGLGGTFDATNIIDPELSIITTISFDHMHILGNSLKEIAENKAGIIKPFKPCLLGNRAALHPMFQRAFSLRSPLYLMPPVRDWMEENTQMARKGLEILFPGKRELDLSIFPPCRFEVVKRGGLTMIFDIAHNIDGLERLFERIDRFFPNQKRYLVFGMSQDKDLLGAIGFIKGVVDEIFCFETVNQRLTRKERLESLIEGSFKGNLESFLQKAEESGSIVVVTGSAYIMKDLILLCS